MHKRTVLGLAALLGFAGWAQAQNTIVVTQSITTNTTWTKNNVYILDDKIYVQDGATLTIEPGTVIKGRSKPNPADATALVIARGGKINANGTVTEPIIFTAEADNLQGNLSQNQRGLWGGVVILGRARTNTGTGLGNVEGIPTTEPRGIYGGNDDDDNSGVLRYVQIRHSGAVVAPNVELNGLTMGAVGRGTVIEYIDVYANADDGFEWFGGTVNTKYLISSFNDDDNFDWDEGFRGKGQFWFAIGSSTVGNQAMEMDGGTTPEDGQPYAIPEVYNVTIIGSGATSANTNNLGLIFRDNSGGKIYNSIFHDIRGYAVRIETESAQTQDSAKRLAAGDLVLANNIFGTFGAGTTDDQLFRALNVTAGGPQPATNYVAEHIKAPAQANRINTDPQLRSISRTRNKGLDPRPAPGSPALTGARTPPNDGFFVATDYIGAFKDTLWAAGWSAISQLGYLTDAAGDTGTGPVPILINPDTGAVNISTIGNVGPATLFTAGFVVKGTGTQTFLIRAVGPTLAAAPFNIANAASNPRVRIVRNDTGQTIAQNDNWGQNANAAQIAAAAAAQGAFPLLANSNDAALLINLPEGPYSAVVEATANGLAIIEVYEVVNPFANP